MSFRRLPLSFSAVSLVAVLAAPLALAGGPRWVAGSSYFDPSALGRPLVWNNGIVSYSTDLGPLSPTVSQAQANSIIAAAAALWSSIPTAAIRIVAAGSLAEDVSGGNFFNGSNGLSMPLDVASSAIGTPLGIIYDADGSVLDTLEGEGASDPNSCNVNAATTVVDNFSIDAKIAHALIILNGRCTADAAHVAVLEYELLRGFGRILGLDWSQANDQMFPANTTVDGLLGWPLMHPVEKLCNSNGNPCMTGTIAPRTDDVAALNRLYPVTSENSSLFPGKSVTAAATLSIQGTISFSSGQGMQGVNVVARPLIAGTGVPDMRYPASAVSGQLFAGDAGNAITGVLGSAGHPLAEFGTVIATLEGQYDLSGIPLPPGATQADYQVTFEPVNPLYTGSESVGPYALGQVAPSGTMPVVVLHGLTAGSTTVLDETIADSAAANAGMTDSSDGAETAPAAVPATGEWQAQLSGYGHSSWFAWMVRGGRQITVEAQPVDGRGVETTDKARIVIGAWNGDDAAGTPPEVGTPQPFNAAPSGLTTLSFESGGDGDVRIGLADQRGDGRPDYIYLGRVLYADTVTPHLVPLGGGPFVIDGLGFRAGNTVTVGGLAAAITSITPMEITAIAPPSPRNASGNVDVVVTDGVTQGWTTIEGSSGTGLAYSAQSGDRIGIVSAPANAVLIGVPASFSVRIVGSDGATPVAGSFVTYTVTQGAAALGCGHNSCTAPTAANGVAAMSVTAQNTALATVTATIADGASVATQFAGAVLPVIDPVSAALHVAAGTTFIWEPQAVVLSAGLPYPGQTVTWTSTSGANMTAVATTTDANGLAWTQVTTSPLAVGATSRVNACLADTALSSGACAAFSISSVDASSASFLAISGTSQTLAPSDPLAPVLLRILDTAGQPIAGAQVTFYETLRRWTSPCPAQGSCPIAPVLSKQTVQAVSAADGSVALNPLTDGIAATHLDVLAVTGDTATLEISVDRHP